MGKLRPVFNIPVQTREQLRVVEENTVDRTPGELAAQNYLSRKPVRISPVVPIVLIVLMTAIAMVVWGR